MNYNRVELDMDILRAMFEECIEYSNVETGGLLCGFVQDEVLRITHASGGGAHSERGAHDFALDVEYSQTKLDNIANETSGRSDFVGTWHRHQSLNTNLSAADLFALRLMTEHATYAFQAPLMLVLGLPDVAHLHERRVTAYAIDQNEIIPVPMEIVSPVQV